MADKMTPLALLKAAGTLEKDVLAVRIGSDIVDLMTPVDPASTLTPIHAAEPAGLDVIRHSSAHVMADAVQRLFPGTKVTFGPSTDDGFYYDFQKQGGGFTDDDLRAIEATMLAIVKKDSHFRREIISRDQALQLFSQMGETFKVEWIHTLADTEELTVYKHGAPGEEWIDFCRGPHVPRTGLLKALKLTHVAGAYWRGDERNPMLQRIYGTAFASKDALEEHLRLIEEAKARDHRKLGKELELFMFDPVAPAMPFFLPKGAFVYNRLIDFMRLLYDRHGYEEVVTPLTYDPKVFQTSGHRENYADNMYRLWTSDTVEGIEGPAITDALERVSFDLKPMNCPSHCIIFGAKRRSYRELPWRIADFARLHRYERGGVVHGLARVRSFCQDDAHIFCTEDQVKGEIEAFIKLLYEVYRAFEFSRIDVKLATRPERRLGTDADWDRSEGALQAGLEAAGLGFQVTPGEGAFYGPKIEFHVQDALKRSWQLGTIQCDSNLPERFDLGYVGEDGLKHRPVMLHRAVLGSLERFYSVLLEHCGGNFPTWLAPKQAIVLTVSDKVDSYADKVWSELRAQGIRVDLDKSADKLGAKIRNARLARIPYLAVVGAKEAESGAVGVRSRDRGELGPLAVADFVAMVKGEAGFPLS
jgi:threonyl-tRNA synthetase